MDLLRKKLASSNVSNTEGQVPSTVEEADYWISEGPSDRAPSDTSVFVEGELPRKYSDPNLNSPFLTFLQFENGLTMFYKKVLPFFNYDQRIPMPHCQSIHSIHFCNT